jgi:integrin beta 3
VLPEDIDVVARAIAEVAAPLLERIAALEARQPGKGEKGEQGERGTDGLDGNHGTDGKDGVDGTNGKDADLEAVKSLIWETVDRAVAALPVAKDGRDGVDGKDGRDGLSGQPGRDGEKGADGLNGKDGSDGMGFGDLVVEHDGERTFFLRAVRGIDSKPLGEFIVPVQIYRNVWLASKRYERGDVVTWAGSMWHANKTTTEKPGEGSKDWTLCVKKGGDGKQGPQGTQGERGMKGEQGPMGPARY